jgi:hypothetical protein
MGVLQISLFFLPIHRRSYAEYCQGSDEYVEEQKRSLAGEARLYEKLEPGLRVRYEDIWQWPPWKFNDIVGYLDVGMDGGSCMTGNIFLKRKCFPRQARERKYSDGTTLRNNHFLYYWEIRKVKVDVNSNETYLVALDAILKEAERTIRERNKSFRLYLPDFDFSCFDFAAAYAQAKRIKSTTS